MTQTARQAYQLVRFDNGRPMRSRIPFEYLDPQLPLLRMFRESEGLDELDQHATSEFELVRAVMQQVKEGWDHSYHFPMQHANALEVLEDTRSGLRGNFCVYFTHVLLQALWSLGIPCRYFYVAAHHWYSHATSECWSNEYRKWIVVDSDFNLCFMRPEVLLPGGLSPVRQFVPQNAREVQQAWRERRMGDMRPVQGPWAAEIDGEVRLGELFGGCIAFLGDYQQVLERGLPEWEGQCRRWYLWSEPGEPLKDYHHHHWQLTFGNGEGQQVSDPEDYYWPLNETVVEPPNLTPGADGALDLRFSTFTPFFAGFEVQAGAGAWQPLPATRADGHRASGTYRWQPGGARGVLRLRSRNTAGRTGPAALLEIATPSCLPPEKIRILHERAYPSMGGIAVQAGRLYVPCRIVYVEAADTQPATIGKELDQPPAVHTAPAEAWPEAVNIHRAGEALPGRLYYPQACATAADGTLYVADGENYRIQVFAVDGAPLTAWGRQGTGDDGFLHLRALAVAPDGTVIVADSGYAGPVGMRTEHISRLRRYSAGGRLLQVLATEGAAPGQVNTPAGLCFDATGNLWVADSGNHRVQRFAADGTASCWGQRGNAWGELRYPTDVAAADDGAIFVADPQHRCVWKFSRDGTPLACLDTGADGKVWLRPGRLAIENDLLYVGDTTTGFIHLFRLA